MIEIRRAGPDESRVLGDIHATSWKAAYAGFFDAAFVADAVEDRRGRWDARLGDDSGTILLAVQDGRPLALSYTSASRTRPGWAEIRSFYAHPDSWGTGVAGTLMTETLRDLRENGYRRVHLWTARDTAQSRRFYRKSGFAETGEVRVFEYGPGYPLDQVEYELTAGA